MDIFLLDSSFRNYKLIEKYTSLLWTDRFREEGDFELVLPIGHSMLPEIHPGSWLGLSESHKIMKVDTLSNSFKDGVALCTIKGLSAESLFRGRSIHPTAPPTYNWEGSRHSSYSQERQDSDGAVLRINRFRNPRFVTSQLALGSSSNRPRYGSTNDTNTEIQNSDSGGVTINPKTTVNDTFMEIGSTTSLNPTTYGISFEPGTWLGLRAEIEIKDVQTGALNPKARSFFSVSRTASGTLTELVSPQAPNVSGEVHVVTWVTLIPANATGYMIRLYCGASKDNGSATWDRLLVVRGTTPWETQEQLDKGYFDGDSTYISLNPREKFTAHFDELIDEVLTRRALNVPDSARENLPMTLGHSPETTAYTTLSPLPVGATEDVTFEMSPASVYDACVDIAKKFDIGFGVWRDFSGGALHTCGYNGNYANLSSNPAGPLVLSPDLGNFFNIEEVITNKGFYNVAEVFGKNDQRTVDLRNVEGWSQSQGNGTSGLARRVLVVDANDIDLDKYDKALPMALQLRGEQELLKTIPEEVVDGEVSWNTDHVYERDFGLGSVVLANGYTQTKRMRITEYIFAADKEGSRSYPTLELYDPDKNPE